MPTNNDILFMLQIRQVRKGQDMEEDILKIINHYGVNHQLKKIHEEYFELDEAIFDYITRDENMYHDREHIAEEIADVEMMLKQFQYYYKIKDEEIEDVMKYKVERTLERIKNEL